MSATLAPAGLSRPSQREARQRRIGDVIVELGFADRDEVEAAVARARATGKWTGQTLLETGVIDAAQLARAVAERYGLDHVDLDEFQVDKGAASLIGIDAARRYRAVPIAFLNDQTLLVATADPANVLAVDDISMMTGYEVRRAVTTPDDVEALIGQLTRLDESVHEVEERDDEPEQVLDLRESAAEAPVVKLVHSIIADAVQRRASDIHFEPRPGDTRVRFRVDGVVVDTTRVPRSLTSGLV